MLGTLRERETLMGIATPAGAASLETSTQPFLVRRAAVLGSGTMGSRIAAHLANAGIPSLLLDLSTDLARKGIETAAKQRPTAFYVDSAKALITPGNFDENLASVAECDWIIEAVTE